MSFSYLLEGKAPNVVQIDGPFPPSIDPTRYYACHPYICWYPCQLIIWQLLITGFTRFTVSFMEPPSAPVAELCVWLFCSTVRKFYPKKTEGHSYCHSSYTWPSDKELLISKVWNVYFICHFSFYLVLISLFPNSFEVLPVSENLLYNANVINQNSKSVRDLSRLWCFQWNAYSWAGKTKILEGQMLKTNTIASIRYARCNFCHL